MRAIPAGDSAGVAIEVEDRGRGIPADDLPRIFEPFFTTREKGTGLGLPLARKLLEAHKGTLTVESRPGRTVFRAELPLPRGGEGWGEAPLPQQGRGENLRRLLLCLPTEELLHHGGPRLVYGVRLVEKRPGVPARN